MAITDTTIIAKSLTSRGFSTVVTTLVVAVGAALLLVLIGAKDAGRQTFARGVGTMDYLITSEDSALVSVLTNLYYTGAPRRPIPEGKFTEIQSSFPFEFFIPTQIGDSYKGVPVVATTTDFFTEFVPNPGEPWAFAAGAAFTEDETDPFQIVAGSQAAKAAGLRVGDTLSVTHGAPGIGGRMPEGAHIHYEFVYRVVGVLEPTGSSHDRVMFSPIVASWILHAHDRRLVELGPQIPLTTAADLVEADRDVTAILARLPRRAGSLQPPAAFVSEFDRLRRDPTITIAAPVQEVRTLFAIVGGIDEILLALAGAVLVSASITVMLALYNSMEQRRRQIAVLRALGCTRRRIFGLVVTESAVLGMAGAIAGVLIGFLGFEAVAAVLYSRTGVVIEPGFRPSLVLWMVVGTTLLAAIAGLVPAASAYRTGVVRNLRPLG